MTAGIQAKNKDGSGKSRLIYVVYDDSCSMVDTAGDPGNPGEMRVRWSQAKYAMEVFAAMMEENDQMVVFPMSLRGDSNLTIKGKDVKRVESIHNWNSEYAGTPWDSITNAAEKLKTQSNAGFDERWLVILTDGKFFDGNGQGGSSPIPPETVQAGLESYASSGIKVSYIAIGEDGNSLQKNEPVGLYVTVTQDTAESVLANVTETANKIFTRMELPGKYVSSNGNAKTLNIDIPTRRIIIFAQGKDAKISGLTYNGQTIKPNAIYSVKCSDVVPESYSAIKDKVKRDTKLAGVVAEFIADDEPFAAATPERKYVAEISGADDANIKYYYTPGADISFMVNGKVVKSSDELLNAGEYDIQMCFVDPVSGQVVESELLNGASFNMRYTYGGETTAIDGTTGHIKLENGELDIEVSAIWQQYGNIRMDQVKHYNVRPEPIALNVEVINNPGTYSPDYLVDNADPVKIRITNANGEALSNEQIEAMEISVDSASNTGIQWDIARGEESGTWNLTPKSADGTISGVKPGASTWTVSAEFHIDLLDAAGSTQYSIKAAEYTNSKLELTAENNGTLDLLHPKNGSVTVTARYEDTSTGEMKPLTEEMWDRLRLKVETQLNNAHRDLKWHVEKGSEVGTYTLTMDPHFFLWRWPFNASGDLTLHMDGSVTQGEYRYAGTLDHPVYVEPFPLWIILLIILIALVIAVAFIGECVKPRIPYSRTGQTVKYNSGAQDVNNAVTVEAKIKRNFWSVVIPFVAETAVVESSKGSWNKCPRLEIKAEHGKKFYVTNKPNSIGRKIRAEEIDFPDYDKDILSGEDGQKALANLKNHPYGYGTFEVATRPEKPRPGQPTRNRQTTDIGKFHFVKKSDLRKNRRRANKSKGFSLPSFGSGKKKTKTKSKPASRPRTTTRQKGKR
ncbi:MAG: hypothetical protein IKS37_05100 [Solobacterium sp.]|nr:hypothetical protein [Solobacterium sp.]